MSIQLLLHTVLVIPEKVEDVDDVVKRARAAGIEVQLDKREQKAVEYATVVQVGPTAFKDYGRENDIIKEGDKVVFAKYAGKPIKHKDTEYLILNDEDVIAIVNEEDK